MANVTSEVQEALKNIDFEKNSYELTFETSMGDINLEFYPEIAPGHCGNMIALAKVGYYDNLTFHRIVPGFVIQGGCPDGTGMGGPGYTIDAEFNDKPHLPGVLSMARTNDPNSAGSQFFLCLEKVPYLDNQYTVFGATKDDESLAVVKAIGAVKTGAQDRPLEDVVIKKATVSEKAK
ncbi:peptidylprolyl isomerase [Pseudobacteriovorax antillogorgiicola]|uniref:Peptidyl-prolyl cis-trans isomerase n=1 Tax=Pseudobacteriovorax antillogorgiicola TaxID=1513793 RepID=A0A1Y6B6N2_9BACT|nr:peptidylprolyl isomerase [Pseudobacteriovorax antillogorgiicola]TCS59474.1 peptidyl-prolyl cis-trans isomerase B (cyclophilin B) [Pseudobacteriovorax antillogorgiicola]SME88028.1 peptidyl-prolyl cis-trans isomerase B (cyclophilin B) [Pseudobacteriovorax antillogorgiicola]